MPDSFDILIRKFIANKCSEQEAEMVIDILFKDPSLIEQYMPINEWEEFLLSKNIPLSPIIKNRIEKNIFNVTNKKYYINYFKYISAACVLFLIAFSAYLYLSANDTATSLGQTHALVKSPVDSHSRFVNTGDSEKEINLPDGSTVRLAPGASISFNKPFSSERNIYLEGEAYFIVAKDKDHPFTVYENGVAVTALGTEFRVRNNPIDNSVFVHLLEGKVVVKPYNNAFSFKHTILYPGQDFTVNNRDRITILNLNKSELHDTKDEYVKEFSEININNESIDFYYTPIDKVVKTLESHFDVNIDIEKNKSLAKNEFTGKVFLKDSLHIILNKISEMNDITFHIIPKNASHPNQFSDKVIVYKPMPVHVIETRPVSLTDESERTLHKNESQKTASQINITSDYILFQYTPLNQVFKTLANYHGKEIEYAGTLNNEFTGKVYHNIPLEKFINNICKINNLKYTKRNNKIIVYE